MQNKVTIKGTYHNKIGHVYTSSVFRSQCMFILFLKNISICAGLLKAVNAGGKNDEELRGVNLTVKYYFIL